MSRYAVGIDIGGTFTDIVFYDYATGRQINRKELTTHDDPARAVLTGIRTTIAEQSIAPSAIVRVVHATTLFTNALIERTGAVTGLITTDGFRDTLDIGKERKYDIYDVFLLMPRPVVPRNLIREVPERLRADGSVERALDIEAVARAASELVSQGVTSLAIVFLHSYANPAHELQAARIIADAHPGLLITISHEIAPEIREYERMSTTVTNAYVRPLAESYLLRLQTEIGALDIAAPFFMMLSNGGLTHVGEAKRAPVQLLESGPAAGALAAAYFGNASQLQNVLAFDMGGTTAKLSLVDDGEPTIAYAFEAAREKRFTAGSGLPIQISVVELIEIGAGGGSIARVGELGLLNVGPRSAGSSPGPAAYGLGGTVPTVTDADFALGYLNPAFFAGGKMRIDMDATHSAIGSVAGELALAPVAVAWGIHDIVNENMAAAARVHMSERGRDPRDYALLPTGGAGPVHAYYVARKLGLPRIVCPPGAGVASALGLLIAPAKVDRNTTFITRIGRTDWGALEDAFSALETNACEVLGATGVSRDAVRIRRLADMRYAGQGFALVVGLPPGPYTPESGNAVVLSFTEAYREAFTTLPAIEDVEIITLRVSAQAPLTHDVLALTGFGASSAAVKGTRQVYFPEAGGFVETPVYDRYALPFETRFEGPAVVEEEESTCVVGPGAWFKSETNGNLVIHLPPERFSP